LKGLHASVGLLLTTLLSSVTAQSTPLLSTPAGTTYVATCAAGTCSTRIPVAISADKKVELQLVDVVYRDGRSDALFKSFSVRLEGSASTPVQAIVVSAQGAELWPGTYALTLRVDEIPRKAEATPQSVVISVQLDAPQVVATTSKVVVSQVVPLFGEAEQPSGTSLKLAERSGKSGVRQLTPLDFRDPPAAGPAGSGMLTFEPKLADVSASGEVTFKVITSGDFPLGTTLGRVEVQSRSLQAPISVPLEIRVRRPLSWILVVAAVGAFIGWLVRTRWNADRALLDAKAAYAAALRAIARASQGRADAEYRLALSMLGQDLADAEETDDPAKIVAAAKKVEEDAARLQKELEDKAKPLVLRAQKLEDIFARDWSVPARARDRLLDLRSAYLSAVEALNRRDVSNAALKLDRLNTNEASRAAASVVDALERLSDILARTTKNSFPMTPPLGAQLSQFADKVKAELQRASTIPVGDRIDALGDLLRRAHDMFEASSMLATSVPLECDRICQQAFEMLISTVPDVRGRFEPVGRVATIAAQSWSSAISDLYGAPYDRADVAEPWVAFLVEVAPKADRAKLVALLDEGKWLESARLAAKANEKAALDVVTTEAALLADEVLEPEGRAGEGEVAMLPRDARPTGFTAGLAEAPTIVALTRQRRALLAQSRWRAAGQSAAFALVFVVGAYFLYGDTWIGTGKEIITLFVLAFGLDLTSDSVVAALKK